eukprot:TRINITY_DN1090_c12_g1_i1.p1 TRINITY_DN1090_c12_g1~~TRINITY_DN1090_c12_g1_i1.p1  ORF type:complete len:244 (+),score=74.87 TRINITY_DN1090_c12_g1_i1:99-734(+)
MAERLRALMRECPVVAILRGVEPREAASVARALAAAGVRVMEVPLNSPDACQSISLMRREVGDSCMVGAGTVLTADQVVHVAEHGGQFIVSPNFDPDVVAAALARGLPALPGVMTPTEAFAAARAGAFALKLFPGEVVGVAGVKALRAVLPPGTVVLAVGGVTPDNIPAWRRAGADGYGVGSSLFKPGMDAGTIQRKAAAMVAAAASAAKL